MVWATDVSEYQTFTLWALMETNLKIWVKPETHLLLQDPEPLLAELRPSSNRFVPHDREVGPRAEVLSDGDGDVQVEHHVPVAAGNEDGLARMLNQLDLKI